MYICRQEKRRYIISQPAKTWKELVVDMEKEEAESGKGYEKFLSNYLYPFIGLLTIAAFLSICTRQEFDIEQALKNSIVTLVSSFGGFYLGAYFLNEVWQGMFKQPKNLKLCQLFVGFSSALMFTLNIVWLLLPDFFFLYIFILYTFYIVWEGSVSFMKVLQAQQMKFSMIATLLIILTPKLIEFILVILMPGLR